MKLYLVGAIALLGGLALYFAFNVGVGYNKTKELEKANEEFSDTIERINGATRGLDNPAAVAERLRDLSK